LASIHAGQNERIDIPVEEAPEGGYMARTLGESDIRDWG
jgi:hypothetical protein